MLIIGGDTFPNGPYIDRLKSGKSIFCPKLQELIDSSAYFISNLECAVTDSDSAIVKCGPNLKLEPTLLPALKNSGFSGFSISNNHVMDFGASGLKDTSANLLANDLDYWGLYSANSKEKNFKLFELGEKKICVVSVCEHEFSVGSSKRDGCYGLKPFKLINEIREHKNKADYVVVLYHGGVEHYKLPTPNQHSLMHQLVDSGADLILCQHSHLIGEIEAYGHGIVFYGQGNFIFHNSKNNSKRWNQGYLISLAMGDEGIVVAKHLIEQDRFGLVTLLESTTHLGAVPLEDELVYKSWLRQVQSRRVDYLSRLYGWSRLRRVLTRKFPFLIGIGSAKRNAIIRNVVECESHHEALVTLWEMEDWT